MFEILEIKDGGFIIRNTLSGGYVNNNGNTIVFKTKKRADKAVDKIYRKMDRMMNRYTVNHHKV